MKRAALPSASPDGKTEAASARALDSLIGAVAPFAFHVGLIVYGLCVTRWVLHAEASPGRLLMGLALLPPIAELAFTRAYEVPVRGYQPAVLVGLAARLLFAVLVGYVFVLVPMQLKGTWNNWFVQDLAESPKFLRIVWWYSPTAASMLALACAAAYGWWTVRRRQGRLTTTTLLPGVATVILFVLLYYFPTASIRGGSGTRPDFVARVWEPASSDHHIPRELMVTQDERYAVATFGSTFPLASADPPPNELRLGRRCDPPNFAECRRNLALIDLTTGATRSWSMTIARRFHSEANDRMFVAPYRLQSLIELRLDGAVLTHPLPQSVGGYPFDEVNDTYYAADTGRVYMANGNNPVVLAWNVTTGRVDDARQLAGWNGLSLGDVPMSIARNRSRARLYVTVKAAHSQVVELDERDLKPLRSLPLLGYDVEVSPDEDSIYVASFLDGKIWRLDADTLELEATFDAPVQCRRIGFSPDGTQLFAASYLTGELVVFDATTGKRLDSFYVGRRLEGMHVAGGGLYLLSAEGMFRVPLEALKGRADAPPLAGS